jgi:hypothetical protein
MSRGDNKGQKTLKMDQPGEDWNAVTSAVQKPGKPRLIYDEQVP